MPFFKKIKANYSAKEISLRRCGFLPLMLELPYANYSAKEISLRRSGDLRFGENGFGKLLCKRNQFEAGYALQFLVHFYQQTTLQKKSV